MGFELFVEKITFLFFPQIIRAHHKFKGFFFYQAQGFVSFINITDLLEPEFFHCVFQISLRQDLIIYNQNTNSAGKLDIHRACYYLSIAIHCAVFVSAASCKTIRKINCNS